MMNPPDIHWINVELHTHVLCIKREKEAYSRFCMFQLAKSLINARINNWKRFKLIAWALWDLVRVFFVVQTWFIVI